MATYNLTNHPGRLIPPPLAGPSARPADDDAGNDLDPAELSQDTTQSAPRSLTVAQLEEIHADGRGLAWPISGDLSTTRPVPVIVPRHHLTGHDLASWALTYQPMTPQED